ncbi:MAG: hypothetical protein QNJ63_06475 [Calothrix sp. MO_192.B10]|nr:hypothetical protein [Calothrix sp. MO_192.B10]
MHRRCDRNRKRSKRRAIYCPIHGCYLDSVSPKYSLFANNVQQLRQRGIGRQKARVLMAAKTTVSLQGEWLEAFWCDRCQKTEWYHVRKTGERSYQLSVAPATIWQRATGAIDPRGNPSVGEFTLKQSRKLNYNSSKSSHFYG